jgi:hypothetical protein
MEIPREVILDLLSLMEAGVASPESRALVEDRLARDPELARLAKAQAPGWSMRDAPKPIAKEEEMKTLERAKRLMNWRSVLLALAVFFAVFPVIYSAQEQRWFWLPVESPVGAAISAALGLVCWTAFFLVARSLRGPRR